MDYSKLTKEEIIKELFDYFSIRKYHSSEIEKEFNKIKHNKIKNIHVRHQVECFYKNPETGVEIQEQQIHKQIHNIVAMGEDISLLYVFSQDYHLFFISNYRFIFCNEFITVEDIWKDNEQIYYKEY